MSRHKYGLTLLEVLVVTVLMGLFTTMVATALVLAYRNYHINADKLTGYRDAMNGLDRLSRRLAVCQTLYEPGPTQFPTPAFCPSACRVSAQFIPLVSVSPMVFSYRSYTPTQASVVVVGYARDISNNTLVEQSYPSYPPPACPLPSPKVIATNISDFEVDYVTPRYSNGVNAFQLHLVWTPPAPSASYPMHLYNVVPVGLPIFP